MKKVLVTLVNAQGQLVVHQINLEGKLSMSLVLPEGHRVVRVQSVPVGANASDPSTAAEPADLPFGEHQGQLVFAQDEKSLHEAMGDGETLTAASSAMGWGEPLMVHDTLLADGAEAAKPTAEAEAAKGSAPAGGAEAASTTGVAEAGGLLPGFNPAYLGLLALGGGGGGGGTVSTVVTTVPEGNSGGGTGSGGGTDTATATATASGKVVLSSVTAGLKVIAYNPTTQQPIGDGAEVAADGSYTLNLGSYSGPVVLVLVDINAEISNFVDESDKTNKDLDRNILAVGQVKVGEVTTLHMNHLTTLAAHQAGVTASGGQNGAPSLSVSPGSAPTQFTATNQKVAQQLGLSGDISKLDVEPVFNADLTPSDPSSLNPASKMEAIVSGKLALSVSSGKTSIDQALESLAKGLDSANGIDFGDPEWFNSSLMVFNKLGLTNGTKNELISFLNELAGQSSSTTDNITFAIHAVSQDDVITKDGETSTSEFQIRGTGAPNTTYTVLIQRSNPSYSETVEVTTGPDGAWDKVIQLTAGMSDGVYQIQLKSGDDIQAMRQIVVDLQNDDAKLSVQAITLTDTESADVFSNQVGHVQVIDLDSNEGRSFAVQGAEGANKTGYDKQVQGDFGNLYFNSVTGAYYYDPDDALINGLKSNSTDLTDSFQFTVTFDKGDGVVTTQNEITLSVNVNGADDLASLTLEAGAELEVVDTELEETNDDDESMFLRQGNLVWQDADDNQPESGGFLLKGSTSSTTVTLNEVEYDAQIEGAYGTLYVHSSTGAYAYQPNAEKVNAAKAQASDAFIIQAGAQGKEFTLSVTIRGVDDLPVVSVSSASFTITDTQDYDSFADQNYIGIATAKDADSSTNGIQFGLENGVAGEWADDEGVAYQLRADGDFGSLWLNTDTGQYRFVANDDAINGAISESVEDFVITFAGGSQKVSITVKGADDQGSFDPSSFNDNGDIELSITDTEGYDQFDSPNSLPDSVKGRLTLIDRDDATATVFQLQRTMGQGIQLVGNTANFTLDGIAYDHSIEGEFGTLYLQSSTGVYVYVPGLMDENGAINYDLFNGIHENTRESFEIVAGYRDQNDDWQEMNVDGGASRTISVNITAGDDKALISAVAMEVQDTPEDDANNSALIQVGQLEVLSLESENLVYGIQDGVSGGYTYEGQSYQVKKESQWGTLLVNSATGSYRYIPNAEKLDQLASGESKKDSFTVSVGSSTGQIDSLASLVVTLVGGDDATMLTNLGPLQHEVMDTDEVDAFNPTTGRIEAKDVDSILTYHLEGTGVTTESIESVLWETISSAYGSLRVNTTTGDYNYRANATAVNALAEGVSKTDAFKVKVGGEVQTIEFKLTGADDAPVASLAQSELTFTEMTGQDDNPSVTQTVSFAALGVTLSDVDGSLIDAVQLTFKAPTQDDRLRIQVANGWMDLSEASGEFQFQGNTFSYENTFNTTSKEASLTLKASSALNSGVYQSLVHALGFNNTSNMPITTSRQFELVAMSGEHRTKPVSFSIKVQETDDAIQIAPASLYGSTGLLRVLGSGKGGESLTVDTSGISDPDLSSSADLQFEYQWQFKATNGSTWTNIGGATGKSYLIPTGVTSGYYRAVVNVRDGLTGHQATELVTMQRQKGFQASLAIALSTSSLTVTEKGQENPSAGETVEVQLFLQDGEDRPAVISKTLMVSSGWTLTNDGQTLSRVTEYGSVSLDMNTKLLSYTLDNSKPKTNALKEGQQITESFEIHANLENDANFKASRSVSFTIKGSNDAPELTVDESSNLQLVEDVTTTASEVSFAVDDVDGGGTPPSVDATGWTKVVASNGGVTYTQQGTYGKATLNLGTGKLSYQLNHVLPATQQLSEGQEVQDAFTIKWVDGSGASVEKKVSFDIKGTNDAPELTVGRVTGELKEDTSNATATVNVTVTDTDANDVIKFVMGEGWASKTVNGVQVHYRSGTYGEVTLNPQTGQLTYQLDNSLDATQGLTEGETVKESVVLEFEDGEGERTESQTVEFTVTGTNEAPTIALINEQPLAELIENDPDHQSLMVKLKIEDPDDSTPPTYRLTEDMGWYSVELGGVRYQKKYTDYGSLQLNASTHELTYTLSDDAPDLENLKEGQTIIDEHDITVVDSQGGVSSLKVGFKIKGSNEAPVVTMGEVQGRLIEDDSENQSAWVQLRASDPDGEINNFILDESQGQYGTATLDSATGKLTYTLDPSFSALNALKAGQTYTETFKVTATDKMGLSTSKEVTFSVEGSNDAPVILLTPSTPLQLTEDAATSSVQLKLAVADPEEGATPPFILDGPWTSNDQETFTQKSALGDATFIKSTGQFTYTIDREWSQFLREGQVGNETFVVRVKDADGGESTQTIKVTVVGVNEVPTLTISTPAELTEAGFDAVGIDQATATLTLFDPDDPYDPEDPEAGVNPVSVDTSANGWTTTADGVTFQQGRYGRIELDSGGTSIRYVLDPALSNALAINATVNDGFEITVKDAQGGIKAETVNFIIHGANDAPTVTVSNTVATLIEAAVDIQGVASAVAELSLSDVDSPLPNYDFDHMQSPQGGWEEGDSSGTTVWRKRGTYGTVELNPLTHKATYTLDNTQLATNRLGETDSVTDPFTLRVKDGAGAHQDLQLEFNITGSNDAPAVTAGDANASLKEDGDNSQLMATRTLTASDPEAGLGLGGGLSQFTFVNPYPPEETGWSTQDGGATYTRTGTYGVATLTIETGELTYQLSNAQDNVQQLKAGSTVTDAFKVQIKDEQGKASLTTDVLFTVEGTNDAPVLTSVQVLDGFIDWDWTSLTFDTVLQNAQVSDIDGMVNGFLITSVPAGSSLEIKAASSAEWVLVDGTTGDPTTFKVGDELRWKPASTTASNQASSEMDLFTIKAVDDQGSTSADGFTVKANVSSRLGSLSAMFTALEAQTDGGSESYILSDGNLYLLNSFTTVGTSAFQAMEGVYEALLVGGGGGGGSNISAGGGGAGGVRFKDFTLTADTEVQVTVGAGGAGGGVGKDLVVPNPGAAAIAVQERGANGGNSVIAYDGETKYIAYGGGGGGGSVQSAGTKGQAGGSGGGGSGFDTPANSAGGAGTPDEGYAGGSGFSTGTSNNGGRGGGGGGGATEAGTSATRTGTTTTAGDGGDGRTTNFTGIELIYGGGGGGGARTSGIAGQGGQGGGGEGGLNNGTVGRGTNAQDGEANTGGGGGGAGGTNSPNKGLGGSGGSGVVHVRYDVTTGQADEASLLAQLEEITGLSLASEHLASYFNAIEAAWKDAGQQSTWWTQAKVTEAVRLHGLNMTAQSQPLVEDAANMREAVRTFSTPLAYAVESDQGQISGWTLSDSNQQTYKAQGTYGTAVLELTSGKVTYTLNNSDAATQSLGEGEIGEDVFFVPWKTSDGTSLGNKSVVFRITGASDFDPASLTALGVSFNSEDDVTPAWTHIHASAFLSKMSDDYPNQEFSIQTINSEGLLEIETSPGHWQEATEGTLLTMDSQLRWADPDQNINDQSMVSPFVIQVKDATGHSVLTDVKLQLYAVRDTSPEDQVNNLYWMVNEIRQTEGELASQSDFVMGGANGSELSRGSSNVNLDDYPFLFNEDVLLASLKTLTQRDDLQASKLAEYLNSIEDLAVQNNYFASESNWTQDHLKEAINTVMGA